MMTGRFHIPIIVLLLVFGSTSLYAQEKYEKESRLKQDKVPALARDFVDVLETDGKVRWYLEEGLESKSIEAKFKRNGQKYSVEFDTSGQLEDVEIQAPWGELPDTVKDGIGGQLSADCQRFKIRKVQIQYSGKREAVLNWLQTGSGVNNLTIRYELVVKCANPKNVALFEYLFSDAGEKLSASQIVFKNSSNLEY